MGLFVFMSWLDHKYINIISNRLEKFKRKSSNLYNFRCCFCMDSKSNKNRARAYFYEKENKMVFFCHNCNFAGNVKTFLKRFDYNMFNDYVMEQMGEKEVPDVWESSRKPVFRKEGILKGLKKVSQLEPFDPIKKFIISRKIPNPFHAKMYSCPNFMTWANTIISNKFSEKALAMDERRLIIPYFNKNKEVISINARSIKKDTGVKYIKLVIDENYPPLYGMDSVDLTKETYVFEGEIDSFFIKNSIATGGGDLASAISSLNKENLVVILDNEPRSKETIKKIDKAIDQAYNVVIFPESFEPKDMNDAIMAGYSSDSLEYIIKTNIYKGLGAKLALSKWSKI